MLQLYIQDNGPYGCIIVAAHDIFDARAIMSAHSCYASENYIECLPFAEGIIYCTHEN